MVKNLPANSGDPGLIPGLGRSLEKVMATHSSILAGKSHGQRSLVGSSPWALKESDKTEEVAGTHEAPELLTAEPELWLRTPSSQAS